LLARDITATIGQPLLTVARKDYLTQPGETSVVTILGAWWRESTGDRIGKGCNASMASADWLDGGDRGPLVDTFPAWSDLPAVSIGHGSRSKVGEARSRPPA
jgi:hypothetical protein